MLLGESHSNKWPNIEKRMQPSGDTIRNPDSTPSSRKIVKVECKICRNSFANKRCLKIHTKNIHDNLRNFECQICSKKFNLFNILRQHVKRTHESQNQEPFECQLCGAKLKTKATLQLHIKIIHENFHKIFFLFRCSNTV